MERPPQAKRELSMVAARIFLWNSSSGLRCLLCKNKKQSKKVTKN
jgi:hypothetical protein